MTPAAYTDMAAHERDHWWFVGRRAALAAVLSSLGLRRGSVLEAGAGTGGNLDWLTAYGEVTAFEPELMARHIAAERGHTLLDGSLPHDIPAGRYDLIAALDVLEHVSDDVVSMRALAQRLSDAGRLVITVPAHPLLWSKHDDRLHHVRRYRRAELEQRLAAAGLRIERLTPITTVLFPLAAALRLLERRGLSTGDQERMPPRLINQLFSAISRLEAAWLRRHNLPWGLAYLVVARKAD